MGFVRVIIPYQELSGSYNLSVVRHAHRRHYTIPRTVRELQPAKLLLARSKKLYHTRNCQGATTKIVGTVHDSILYHTKNCQGATTVYLLSTRRRALYHTKNCQGATTMQAQHWRPRRIIPYQELSGSYNLCCPDVALDGIIPYQELSGSYNSSDSHIFCTTYYTIPRTVRELQLGFFEINPNTKLYHTKNCQGATTQNVVCRKYDVLYHTKNCQGATTL